MADRRWSPLGGDVAEWRALISRGVNRRFERMRAEHGRAAADFQARMSDVGSALAHGASSGALGRLWMTYAQDAMRRGLACADALRARGDIYLAHSAAGAPPVLVYEYEVVLDGRDLPRPCNYMLLKIDPPEELRAVGVQILDWKRPYVIIDPRAGHGAGIGGFKIDSQVGVALRDGHPVYFVAFRPDPAPGQTLADVTHAEAAFVREVRRRHPKSAKPIVVGNCQGGWGAMLLAATHPDLTGPVVINGAPLSYWSGKVGAEGMRYGAGLRGGAALAMLLSDLGGGKFDGANLVMNFEALNPGRTWFRKYADLYQNIDRDRDKFLEFERWWGGFFLMNADEIQWVVEQLFVGDRLARNEARLEPGRPVDLKQIRSPIIVFSSWGDTITPPSQALNWILDTYADEHEIKIRGQRILYMIHDEVGHLGIFVSSSIARKEHAEVASTLKTIEALAPGLYEMKIDKMIGEGAEARFEVSFEERRCADLEALDGGRDQITQHAFAAVARMSEAQAEAYDAGPRRLVQALAAAAPADRLRDLHPMRLQRAAWSSKNPFAQALRPLAEMAGRRDARPADGNPFLRAEALWIDGVEQSMNLMRDIQAVWAELAFFGFYGAPWMRPYAERRAAHRTLKRPDELRALPEVQAAVAHMRSGGFASALVRMLIMLAEARGGVRRDRLERSSRVLTQERPFSLMDAAERARLIHEQTLIVEFGGDEAMAALSDLLPDPASRSRAWSLLTHIIGPREELTDKALSVLNAIEARLRPGAAATVAALNREETAS